MTKRTTWNLLVDSLAFAAFVTLTTAGVLVRYVLPPGSGHSTTLWGMDRHEWGGIHFWLAVILLAICVLHIFLHWRWITSVVRGRPREGSGFRVALAFVGLLALSGLAMAPLLSSVEKTGDASPEGEGRPANLDHAIHGSMTLRELEDKVGVAAEVILEALGLPRDVPRDQKLGQLRRKYGFEMDDLRDAVERIR